MGVLGYVGAGILILFLLLVFDQSVKALQNLLVRAISVLLTPALGVAGFYYFFYEHNHVSGVLFWVIAILHLDLETLTNDTYAQC